MTSQKSSLFSVVAVLLASCAQQSLPTKDNLPKYVIKSQQVVTNVDRIPRSPVFLGRFEAINAQAHFVSGIATKVDGSSDSTSSTAGFFFCGMNAQNTYSCRTAYLAISSSDAFSNLFVNCTMPNNGPLDVYAFNATPGPFTAFGPTSPGELNIYLGPVAAFGPGLPYQMGVCNDPAAGVAYVPHMR